MYCARSKFGAIERNTNITIYEIIDWSKDENDCKKDLIQINM